MWFHLRYYYYRRSSSSSSSKGWSVNSLIFEDISMKLGGQMGHGPNSSYHDV